MPVAADEPAEDASRHSLHQRQLGMPIGSGLGGDAGDPRRPAPFERPACDAGVRAHRRVRRLHGHRRAVLGRVWVLVPLGLFIVISLVGANYIVPVSRRTAELAQADVSAAATRVRWGEEYE